MLLSSSVVAVNSILRFVSLLFFKHFPPLPNVCSAWGLGGESTISVVDECN